MCISFFIFIFILFLQCIRCEQHTRDYFCLVLTSMDVNTYVWGGVYGLFSLFNGEISFVGYLMSKPSLKKNSSGTI